MLFPVCVMSGLPEGRTARWIRRIAAASTASATFTTTLTTNIAHCAVAVGLLMLLTGSLSAAPPVVENHKTGSTVRYPVVLLRGRLDKAQRQLTIVNQQQPEAAPIAADVHEGRFKGARATVPRGQSDSPADRHGADATGTDVGAADQSILRPAGVDERTTRVKPLSPLRRRCATGLRSAAAHSRPADADVYGRTDARSGVRTQDVSAWSVMTTDRLWCTRWPARNLPISITSWETATAGGATSIAG